MKLRDFFGTVTPFLTGRQSHAEAVEALYGGSEGAHHEDARRLALYGRFCRIHRFEVIDSLYPHCRRGVLERQGEAGWEALVEGYFRAHPMTLFELNANGAQLSEFLAGYAPGAGLPGWLPELADLEWWEWEVLVAPDREPEEARPCLAPTVELRPYAHDLVGWLDTEPEERAAEPEAREALVIFWRQGRGFRRENVSPLELRVIKALHEGLALEAVADEDEGAGLEQLEETLADLVAAGIVLAADDEGS